MRGQRSETRSRRRRILRMVHLLQLLAHGIKVICMGLAVTFIVTSMPWWFTVGAVLVGAAAVPAQIRWMTGRRHKAR